MRLTKRSIFFLSCFVALLTVIFVIIYVNKCDLREILEETDEIVILKEASSEEVKITNVKLFIENLNFSQWTKLNTFDKKFMPVYYLCLKPSGEILQILGTDSEVVYFRFADEYYEASVEVYNYILSFVAQ